MKKNLRSKIKRFILFITICLIFTSIRIYLVHSRKQQELEKLLNLYVSNVENDLDYALSQVYAVQALVVGAGGDSVDLEKAAQILRRDTFDRFVSCVFLAPGGIVEQVYPSEGNEYTLGLDLFSAEYENADSVMEAQKTGELTVSYPHTTKKGNVVIIGRLPVYLPNEYETYDAWGIVSVGVAFPEIFEHLRTDILKEQGYVYRILNTEEGYDCCTEQINYGFHDVSHTIRKDFTLAGMKLCIEAAPEDGWLDTGDTFLFLLKVSVLCWLAAMLIEYIVKNIRKLALEAKTDELTGLLNRSFGEKEINRIIHEKNFVKDMFLMVDIDNFKTVNDTFGHQRGDEALVRCADLLNALFHKNDMICRLGGDEFVVFISYAGDDSFLEETIRQLLSAVDCEIVENGKTVHISASLGAASAPRHGVTFAELYAKADAALYRSKMSGRNCYTIYEEVLKDMR